MMSLGRQPRLIVFYGELNWHGLSLKHRLLQGKPVRRSSLSVQHRLSCAGAEIPLLGHGSALAWSCGASKKKS